MPDTPTATAAKASVVDYLAGRRIEAISILIGTPINRNWETAGEYTTLFFNYGTRTLSGVRISVKYGNTVLSTITLNIKAENGYRLTWKPRKQWFADMGVTTLKTVALTMELVAGSTTDTDPLFFLTAGQEMSPVVSNVDWNVVNTGRVAEAYPDKIISGMSKIHVTANVTAGSNAAITSVKLQENGKPDVTMTLNSTTGKYEGTTSGPISGNWFLIVEATDQRSMSGTGGAMGTSVSYRGPTVQFDTAETFRCDSTGEQTLGGLWVRVKAEAIIDTSLENNRIDKLEFYVQEDGPTRSYQLESGVQSEPKQVLNGTVKGPLTVVVVIQDRISDEITRTLLLPGELKNFVLKQSSLGTYLGIGRAPLFYGGLYGYNSCVDIPEDGCYLINGIPADCTHLVYQDGGTLFGKDFLNVNYNDRYAQENRTTYFEVPVDKTGWTNCPSAVATSAFKGVRLVFRISALQAAVVMFETAPQFGRIWYHATTPLGTFTSWFYISSTQV